MEAWQEARVETLLGELVKLAQEQVRLSGELVKLTAEAVRLDALILSLLKAENPPEPQPLHIPLSATITPL